MVRSVPEKTFEHWASMYVAHRFPMGGLWWPSSGEDIRVEDLGTVPGKAVLLEVKVPEQQPDGSHLVSIDLAQLAKYLSSPIPVYYLFPVPPWTGQLAGSAWLGAERRADLAYRRAAHRWFGDWTVVCTAAALSATLGTKPGQKTATMSSLPPHWRWRNFWTDFRGCGSPVLPSAFILDDPLDAGELTRARLRQRCADLRRLRRQERPAQRDSFVDALRHAEHYRYVPREAGPSEDVYRLVQDVELSDALASLLDRPDDVGGDSALSLCHVPFFALD